jgi:quercetin dioxygenase-like cupin family protein
MAGVPPAVFRWSGLDLDKVTEMVSRKEIRDGRDSLVQTYLKKGAVIPIHRHAGPQWIYVLQGALSITLSAKPVILHEGDVLHVPAGAPHHGEALDDTFVLDIRSDV